MPLSPPKGAPATTFEDEGRLAILGKHLFTVSARDMELEPGPLHSMICELALSTMNGVEGASPKVFVRDETFQDHDWSLTPKGSDIQSYVIKTGLNDGTR